MLRKMITLPILLTFLAMPPARAASTVTMDEMSFVPAAKTISVRGGAEARRIVWDNTSGSAHQSVRSGVFPWDSDWIPSGEQWSKVFKFAGAFRYECTIHQPDMDGTIKVKPFAGLAGSNTIALGETARVLVGSEAPPDGVVFDIQRKVGGDWTNWRTGITNRSVSFRPSAARDYQFRARTRKPSISSASGWSPVATLHVTD